MRFAGAFAVIAYVAAWTALFGRRFVDSRDRTIVPRTVLAALVGPAGILTLGWAMSRPVAFVLIPALLIAPLAMEVVLLSRPARRTFLPLLAFLCTLPAGAGLIKFARIAYEMWTGPVYQGAVRYGSDIDLAAMHVLLILGTCVLTGVLIFRLVRREPKALLISAVASLAYAISVGTVVFMTIPRRGDEGLLMWIFIVPVFALGDLALLGLSLASLSASLTRLRMRGIGRPRRGLQPASGSAGPHSVPASGSMQ